MSKVITLARVVLMEMIRRKDFYILLILLAAFTLGLTTLNSFGAEAGSRYIMDLGLLMIWIFTIILAVTLTGRQLPSEEQTGTIYPLLAKPVSRLELIMGKWLGSWLAVVVASIVFYLLLILLLLGRGETVDAGALFQSWVMHAVLLGVVASITLALSVRMSYGATATTSFVVQTAIFLIIPRIPVVITYAKGFRRTGLLLIYYALPHFELFDMRIRLIHGWGIIPWTVFAMVIAYGLVVTAFFLAVSWRGYAKKCFKRGAAV